MHSLTCGSKYPNLSCPDQAFDVVFQLVPAVISRYGLRGRELINNVGKVMLQGGGTFGTFMAIGTGIRC